MVITSEYTGNSLRDYIAGSQVLQYKKRDFVQAVIDNIMSTLTRNPKVTSLLNIQDIDVRKLRTIVFRIIYAIIYMNTQKIKPTSVKFMIYIW